MKGRATCSKRAAMALGGQLQDCDLARLAEFYEGRPRREAVEVLAEAIRGGKVVALLEAHRRGKVVA